MKTIQQVTTKRKGCVTWTATIIVTIFDLGVLAVVAYQLIHILFSDSYNPTDWALVIMGGLALLLFTPMSILGLRDLLIPKTTTFMSDGENLIIETAQGKKKRCKTIPWQKTMMPKIITGNLGNFCEIKQKGTFSRTIRFGRDMEKTQVLLLVAALTQEHLNAFLSQTPSSPMSTNT